MLRLIGASGWMFYLKVQDIERCDGDPPVSRLISPHFQAFYFIQLNAQQFILD
jgi:hypothetical protein